MAVSPCSRGCLWSGISNPRGDFRMRNLRSDEGCAFRLSLSQSSLRISARAQVKASSTSQEAEGRTENGASSFLDMWERAKQKESHGDHEESPSGSSIKESGTEDWARRDRAFKEMLQVPNEERDRIQRRQIVDRAAAALAAANAFLAQYPVTPPKISAPRGKAQTASKPESGSKIVPVSVREVRPQRVGGPKATVDASRPSTPAKSSTFEGIPGPDFWSWVPEPLDAESRPPRQSKSRSSDLVPQLSRTEQNGPSTLPWEENDEGIDEDLPLIFQSRAAPSLPPFQSLLEIKKEELKGTEQESLGGPQTDLRMPEPDTEIASSVNNKQRVSDDSGTSGLNEDGSRWWKETGVEYRDDGVACSWTVIRGVSADGGTEWEEKFWEASDAFDYKELGAEKSGRDASGRVWREIWKETMWQDFNTGLQHIEKTADKWAQGENGEQWHEKWYEHYDASGRADKWADKWSQINPNTPLEPGHAHCWHERWGETYDGHGGTVKYTDKWAERQEESGGWTKWGDKWDEHFDQHGQGVRQGETWWQGTSGERWNRTWGERHNQTGWVHKYGKSSDGEHWDTHEEEETWYQGKPHFGFRECFEHSVVLRRVGERKRQEL